MNPRPSVAPDRLEILEMRVHRLVRLAAGLALLLVATLCIAWHAASEPDVLRVRGLVVVDADGRERVLIGAPVPESAGRRSPIRGTGVVILDEDGADRLVLGESRALLLDGEVVERERAYSLLVHDRHGDERGGMGTFDSGKAVVVLDRARPDSDGVALIVDEGADFVGFTANHRQREGRYVQAVALGVQRGTIYFNLDDPAGRRRLALTLPPEGAPACRILPADGGEPRDVFER